MYRIHSVLILAALIATFAIVAYVALGPLVAGLIVVTASLLNFGSRESAARLILRSHNARALTHRESPWFRSMTMDLAEQAGITMHLAIYPSDIPNAFALTVSKT